MKLSEFRQIFKESSKTQQIVSRLEDHERSHIHLIKMVGSIDSLTAIGVYDSIPLNQIFILPDAEEAAYFLNDLEAIVGDHRPLFYPKSWKKAYTVEDTDNANVLLRTEVLNKVGKSQSGSLVVTYPEAIMEKVVTKKKLQENTFRIELKNELSIDFLNDVLYEYDFERVDFVSEPGQFSIRGGIVDVYSFSNNQPYRIGFFGDTVESIRTFDPVSQLSISPINHLSLTPNVQRIESEEYKESFLQFMPENTVFWMKDFKHITDKIEKEFKDVLKNFNTLKNSPLKHDEPEDLFITKEEFSADITKLNTIEFGRKHYLTPDLEIEYNLKPQPAFNKNFELLSKTLVENQKHDFQNIILASSSKQVERLYAIFEDIEKEINFIPILMNLHEGFVDLDLKLACYTDHQIFNRYHRYRLKESFKEKDQAFTLKEIMSLKPGDYITHIDHGVGQFSGLEKIDVNGKKQEAIRILYKNNDTLYVNIHSLHRISKYVGKDGTPPAVDKIGSNNWQKVKQKTKNKVKELAFDLIKLYAERKTKKGFAFSPDNYLQNELEASFLYDDTPDQLKATQEVKADMEKETPMDRLVCGDVGFGKTEVAIRAAFKAICDSKQVAVLVPTTILALQHYKTFKNRLREFPCKIDYINRFKTAKQQAETIEKVKNGEIDILIGTHRIVGKDIEFKDLGLLIIDEEQKFGVNIKDKLKRFKVNVDTLTLTATPIPRTLQFSLMNARDLSIINTPPPNRQPIHTEVHTFNEEIIRDAITKEVSRGGQVFFINDRVQNIQEVAGMVQRICPDIRVLIAHGQMNGDELEQKMVHFIDGDFDVLIATTIIESGLDIPNANTIIINHAHMFGLSDLHQMRGRVGRSNKKAYCYLLAPPFSVLTPEGRKRLETIEKFTDLGSGFQIAMKDLDIRGAGNLLGADQSGFISEMGFDMYQKILDEAIQELKETEFKDLYKLEENPVFVNDFQLETDLEILIPDRYVSSITERLELYKEIDNLTTEEKINKFREQLIDRFGPVPKSTQELLNSVKLRWIAKNIGFEKLVLKQGKLIGYFIQKKESPYYQSPKFTEVLNFVQQNQSKCQMKERNDRLSLVFEKVDGIEEAINLLEPIVSTKYVLSPSA